VSPEDIPEIDGLYHPYSSRHINVPRVTEALETYPSVAAIESGRIVGFAYCFRFAPDILELANIYVDSQARAAGLGSRMLDFMLSQISDAVEAVIAVNSDLYPVNSKKKRPDTFYLRNGFIILASTRDSTVYWWNRV
jgi:N-acetylglutamate synthase-like GNAT family acetyltransferase